MISAYPTSSLESLSGLPGLLIKQRQQRLYLISTFQAGSQGHIKMAGEKISVVIVGAGQSAPFENIGYYKACADPLAQAFMACPLLCGCWKMGATK